ncbi:Mss4-like protein [Nemania sp. NC0429]|nr:Mss4-like protein [Nemania sp. NC0429]KAI1109902.1 Mss4-like protein [Nemania sp. NC0429]
MDLSSKTLYNGNCHCGRYRFQVYAPNIQAAISCTCRLCRKKAYLWLIPGEDDFIVVRDEGYLTAYESGSLRDRFCSICGIGVVGEHTRGPLKGSFCVNIRTLQGVNPFEIESLATIVDTPDAIDEQKLGTEVSSHPLAQKICSCHCGKTHAELLIPLQGQELKEDNCSSCARIGYIGVYPTNDEVILHGKENTSEYLYGRKYTGVAFCKTCGVHVFSVVHGPPLTILDTIPAGQHEHFMSVYRKSVNLQPLNIRSMEEVDLASLHITRTDEGTEGYALD